MVFRVVRVDSGAGDEFCHRSGVVRGASSGPSPGNRDRRHALHDPLKKGNKHMLREKSIKGLSGWLMLVVLIILLFLFVAVFVDSVRNERPEFAALAMVLLILDCLGFGG